MSFLRIRACDGDDFFSISIPMGEFLWGEGARWERTFREGGVDGVVEGLALFSGALLLRNVL